MTWLTRAEVEKQVNVHSRTIFNWSQYLRDTYLVRKTDARKFGELRFHQDFVEFLKTRVGRGRIAGSRPSPEVIAEVTHLHCAGKSTDGITEEDIQWIGF